MSTALRSLGLLDVLSKYACGALGSAPCIHARLRRLATKPGEKCGLVDCFFLPQGGLLKPPALRVVLSENGLPFNRPTPAPRHRQSAAR